MSTTRRRFLEVSALAGGGFALAIALPRFGSARDTRFGIVPRQADDGAELTAFLRVHPDGRAVFVSPNLEMGQGVFTSHAMIVAEELDADMDRFESTHSGHAPAYNNPVFGMMGTGGSTSTAAFFMPLRQAGATARAMLLAAAAERWGVPVSGLRTEPGRVIGPDGQSADYGELAEDAARQTPPENVPLKDPSQFRIIGTSARRVEGPDKVTGRATFGMDVQLPGMLTAVVARPPTIGGSSRGVRNEAEILAMPGVRKIKPIPTGIAILADSYWAAKRACDRIDVDWAPGPNASLSTEELYERYRELAETPGAVAEDHGDAEATLASQSESAIEGTFLMPFLAHAPMEPLNATAHVRDGEAELWAGTQFQTVDAGNIAARLGIGPERVTIHTMLAGGGFGRRATPDSDIPMEAVEAAIGEDVPVKVVLTREDDTRGGKYRPLTVHRIEATLGQDGLPSAWRQRVVTQSIMTGTPFEPMLVQDGIDQTSVEGAAEMPYAVPNRKIELHSPEATASGLWWRSVGHTHTAFAGEHFLDILAREAGQDPLEYRRRLLRGGDPRLLGVLDRAATEAGWGRTLPEGRALGVALRKSFESYVCEIFECSVASDGVPVVHQVTAAVDVGIAVNPWNIEQQVQGAVVFGMTAALYGAIDIQNGHVLQSNFHDYRMLRMHEMPPIDVHIVESREAPTGIGEPGVPPAAPAMANAKLALTGEPTYRLPFTYGRDA